MSQYTSFADRLSLLSVRILDDSNDGCGSGFLYIHDNKTAYILTAAHVIQPIESSFVVEFHPDLDDVEPDREKDYRIRSDRTAVRCASADVIKPGEKRVDDIAVIELNIEGYPRIQERARAEFAPVERRWRGRKVTGNGYPRFKNDNPIEEASVTAESECARCKKHISRHYMEWQLGIDVRDPESGDETHGWSGSVMVLEKQEPFVMVGFVLSMPKDYLGGETYGADMYHARRILETEFGIKVREATVPKAVRRKKTTAKSSCGLYPSPQRTEAWIYGSRDKEIARLKMRRNDPLYLCGPAGWGKSELARAIAAEHELGGKSYTIPYLLSAQDDEHMKNSFLVAEYTEEKIQGCTRDEREKKFQKQLERLRRSEDQRPLWLIIDDFYHPHLPADRLWQDNSFKQLLDLGNFLIFTTRYDLNGYNRYTVPYMFADQMQHKRALIEQMRSRSKQAEITEAQFEEFFALTNGNLLLAEWTAKTLATFSVKMDDILYAFKTGDFSKATFECIADERSGDKATLKDHILNLYDWGCLSPEEANVLALLQFADAKGLPHEVFRELNEELKKNLSALVGSSWCKRDRDGHRLEHILKLACRCKGLVPNPEELHALLEKMHQYYGKSESEDHRKVIRAYYTAAAAYLGDEARLWYEEICCEQQKKGGEAHDGT